MKEQGFISGAMLYVVAIGGGIIASLSVALWWQTSSLQTCQAEFGAFKLETKRLGEAAEKVAKEKAARDLKLKEATDATLKRTVDRLNRDVRRLRDERARGRSLQPSSAAASGLEGTCVQGGDILAAFRRFAQDVSTATTELDGKLSEIAAEADRDRAALNSAKAWAQSLQD